MSPLYRHSAALLCSGLMSFLPDHSRAQVSVEPAPRSISDSKPSVLSPFVVSTKPIGSFGLSVKATRDGLSARIADLTILDVIPNTDADKKGLGPLTQILSIDGRSVKEFAANFDKGSDLSLKLIDRKQGDRITLEVLILGARKAKHVTLTEGHGVHQFPNESDSEIEPLRTVHIGVSH